jgi:ubiquinone/menaquinone biosynthesis C-methylase UbiE
MTDRDLLDEQIAYYRARAPEYDEWVDRLGIYDHGPEWKHRWDREVAQVRAALDAFAPTGRVLELACGTGWWTQALAGHASELTCVDASPEAIAIARTKVDARYVVADIFEWEPDARYDVVFFSFWISHVPDAAFEAFFAKVERALAPGGRVFLMDNLKNPSPTAPHVHSFVQQDTSADGIVTRTLNDGREFRAVKIYYEPDELKGRLAALGWRFEFGTTDTWFYYGWGERG